MENKLPVLGDLCDEAFERFKLSSSYEHLIKPLQDTIGYPDNYLRRLWNYAFYEGRVSKLNFPTTTGEAIKLKNKP